jgi:hypothetical protein
VEAGMLQTTTVDVEEMRMIDEATNATILGALVLHVNAGKYYDAVSISYS